MGVYFLLVAAGFIAGVMNAVAGGGSFLPFPALGYSGVPSIIANASSTVALFPGAFASAWGYREDFRPVGAVRFSVTLAVCLAGGLVGALLLLFTPQSSFDRVIPWLLLLATLVFALGPRLAPWLERWFHIGPRTMLVAQFFVAVYGGYFGGAVGLMMLAHWGIFGLHDLRPLNATRVILVG